jgi:hypothetical protein
MPFGIPPWSVLITWPASNYVDPPTRGPANYIIGAIFLSLSTTAVAFRLYARLYIRRWFGLDDVCICLAWVRQNITLQTKLTPR